MHLHIPVLHFPRVTLALYANDYLFEGVETQLMEQTSKEGFQIGRYHSWVVDAEGLPECLEVTSVSDEGFIMSLRHKEYDIRGIQYHPESVLTPAGKIILGNWLKH